MLNNLFIFGVALFMIIQGATMSTKYSARLAENFNFSKYVIGLIIVSVISILPETFISINAAFDGVPEFGLGALLGSNVADLTLVFAIIIFVNRRGLKVESKILKNKFVYPLILLLPLILGANGHFSRMEGLALILAGGVFYYLALKDDVGSNLKVSNSDGKLKNFLILLISLAILLIGSHFVVTSATDLAVYFNVNPIFIGMFIVGLGTVIPELFFSLKSVRKHDDSLAVGDLLGTVLADATIVVGLLALINPFVFPKRIIYVTGVFMFLASLLLFRFMKTGKIISRKEALILIFFWLSFVTAEVFIGY